MVVGGCGEKGRRRAWGWADGHGKMGRLHCERGWFPSEVKGADMITDSDRQ